MSGGAHVPMADVVASDRRHVLRDAQGMTLVELLVAIVLLCVGVLGTIALIDGANAQTASTSAREGATSMARRLLETSRTLPYHSLDSGLLTTALQATPGLADQSSISGWNLSRRNVTYTIAVTVCTVDDPVDGRGSHSGAGFCTDSAAGSGDLSPDDYKRVVIEITWSSTRGLQRTTQATLVVNPGRGSGPAVNNLVMTSPSANPLTSDVTEASFSVTTSRPPAAVRWSVEGVQMGVASGSETGWSFSWPVASLRDGTYLVGAEALDSAGVGGAVQSITVSLNRFTPAAPGGFAAGRNAGVVDLEWLAAREGDLVGYRAYRVEPGGGATEVCALTAEIACRDEAPPTAAAVDYYVVSVDRAPNGSYREGALSSLRTVTLDNHAPNPPTGLVATAGEGSVTLAWTAPDPSDPDAADSIAFYRIYRDGAAYVDRYDRTGDSAELTYTDAGTDGTPHTYRVTAVDPQLAESAFAGPVTR